MKPTACRGIFLVFLTVFQSSYLPLRAQDNPPHKLQIVIVEGDGAIDNIKQRVNREVIVEVQDENHKPVAAAAVVFFLPGSGPSGVFSDGSTTFTTTTDSAGRAVARGIRLNNVTGRMDVRVTASAGGATVTAIVTETLVSGVGAVGLSATAKVLIILGVVAGAAAGVAVGLTRGGGSSGGSPSTPPITISAGPVTVGGPSH